MTCSEKRNFHKIPQRLFMKKPGQSFYKTLFAGRGIYALGWAVFDGYWGKAYAI